MYVYRDIILIYYFFFFSYWILNKGYDIHEKVHMILLICKAHLIEIPQSLDEFFQKQCK